jgi:CAAX protease family protein
MGSTAVGEPHLLMPEPRSRPSALSYLYTFAIVAILLIFSLAGQDRMARVSQSRGHVLLYSVTILWEFVLLGLVWFGARLARLSFRELIGGRWNKFEDFLLDVVIAIGFWVFSLTVLAGLGYVMGLSKGTGPDEARRLLQMLAPRNVLELVLWILLSSTAGFCEEIIFRGYLQRQFASLTRNIWIGMLISAMIFGLSHAYEGRKRMVLIAIYGALFGTLTILRKSLRPGMMAHALQDTFVGVGAFIASRMGVIK